MWMVLFQLYFLVILASGLEFGEEHVCQQEERYTVNVTKHFLRNITIRSFEWCYQLPPRCSVFHNKVINDTKIVEEEKVRKVNICCKGYYLDSLTENCVPECKTNCENGECNQENKCYCHPGFRGDHCEKECDSLRWGRFCRYHCTCEKGICNIKTGECTCPPGWKGSNCESRCDDGYFGEECKQECQCKKDEFCNPLNGNCSGNKTMLLLTTFTNKYKGKVPTLKKYHTFDISTITKDPSNTQIKSSNNNVTKSLGLYILTTKSTDVTRELSITTSKTTKENDASTTTDYKLLANFDTTGDYVTTDKYISSKQELADVNIKITNRTIDIATHDSSKGKAFREVSGTILKETSHNDGDVPLGVVHRGQFLSNNRLLVSITVAIIAAILITTTGLYIALNRARFNRKPDKNGDAATVSVTTRSIFHSPLPDPPFETFFCGLEPKPSLLQTTSTEIVCNVNTTNPKINCTTNGYLELFYDHPPSTGSYRAAVVPEPPEMKEITEPLYDEIPCWSMPINKNIDNLYSNTRTEGNTRF